VDAAILQKKISRFWTQGAEYNFEVGDTIYDTPLAYQKWNDALKNIRLKVQIEKATPSTVLNYEDIKILGTGLDYEYRKKTKSEKEISAGPPNNIVVKKTKLKHGDITFTTSIPNNEKTSLHFVEKFKCTQDDFVSFLQTGIVRTKNNNTEDLFKKYYGKNVGPL